MLPVAPEVEAFLAIFYNLPQPVRVFIILVLVMFLVGFLLRRLLNL